eukprot:CAMPEP_0118660810 /NCGR_PEP_ID=MMETSP0785-20121206/15908_1 /TAXON_ID=91992 /ORGANISM="Bolidomonas pacifica, Strain CCMP 1866" /LENGTH=165 /DNA_ID=CAMNT_0006554135 /DNA_START=80 /DNA_END=574 /DNA_ORIENTATION=+
MSSNPSTTPSPSHDPYNVRQSLVRLLSIVSSTCTHLANLESPTSVSALKSNNDDYIEIVSGIHKVLTENAKSITTYNRARGLADDGGGGIFVDGIVDNNASANGGGANSGEKKVQKGRFGGYVKDIEDYLSSEVTRVEGVVGDYITVIEGGKVTPPKTSEDSGAG